MVSGGKSIIEIEVAIIVLTVWLIIESFLCILTLKIREKFQWFITPEDEHPTIKREKFERFIDHSYDHHLGWVRKPNTSKVELGTSYYINENGARHNPTHEGLPVVISTYGDSFTFCRQNNDHTTWQWYLSEMTRTNVLNFGVGNYGFDQALLRLMINHTGKWYSKDQSTTVIIGVVPSTIVRIMCMWKHYNEYGNILGFKPRYKLFDNGKGIFLIPMRHRELQNDDYFYKRKFKKDQIKFPYVYHWLKPRNLKIARRVLKGDITEAYMVVQKENLKLRKKLYKNKEAYLTLYFLVKKFVKHAEEQGYRPIFMMLPQKDDMTCEEKFYQPFLDDIREFIEVIDITEAFEGKDLDELYSDDNEYGGHPNPKGNKLIAEFVYSKLHEESRWK